MRPTALLPAKVHLPARLRYFQQPCDSATRVFRGIPYSHQGRQALAFSNLALRSPSQTPLDQMAGSRNAIRANKAVKSAEVAVDIKPDPKVAVANGVHAENGVALETQGPATAVDGVKQPKARKSRANTNGASGAVKSAEVAVDIKPDPGTAVVSGVHSENGVAIETQGPAAAVNGVKQPKARKSRAKANGSSRAVKSAEVAVDTKPDPEAAVLNGLHAGNGVAVETQGPAAAVNGVKQPKARKSRAKANGASKPPLDPTVKLESGESVTPDLAASIQ